jgi:hypothetical protein
MLSVIRPDFEVVKKGRILHKRDYDRLLTYHLLAGPERQSFLDYIIHTFMVIVSPVTNFTGLVQF